MSQLCELRVLCYTHVSLAVTTQLNKSVVKILINVYLIKKIMDTEKTKTIENRLQKSARLF